MSKGQVIIRIWDGCVVRQVVTVSPTGSGMIGAVGGAGNSVRPDIELDPWQNLIVDHRVQWPIPVSIREEPEAIPPRKDDDETNP